MTDATTNTTMTQAEDDTIGMLMALSRAAPVPIVGEDPVPAANDRHEADVEDEEDAEQDADDDSSSYQPVRRKRGQQRRSPPLRGTASAVPARPVRTFTFKGNRLSVLASPATTADGGQPANNKHFFVGQDLLTWSVALAADASAVALDEKKIEVQLRLHGRRRRGEKSTDSSSRLQSYRSPEEKVQLLVCRARAGCSDQSKSTCRMICLTERGLARFLQAGLGTKGGRALAQVFAATVLPALGLKSTVLLDPPTSSSSSSPVLTDSGKTAPPPLAPSSFTATSHLPLPLSPPTAGPLQSYGGGGYCSWFYGGGPPAPAGPGMGSPFPCYLGADGRLYPLLTPHMPPRQHLHLHQDNRVPLFVPPAHLMYLSSTPTPSSLTPSPSSSTPPPPLVVEKPLFNNKMTY